MANITNLKAIKASPDSLWIGFTVHIPNASRYGLMSSFEVEILQLFTHPLHSNKI